MLFVRAPDENVYIPPFNLIEIVLVCTLEWWMDKRRYEVVNDWVMGFIYSPLLLVAAWTEKRTAIEIRLARKRGDEDDDTVEEWEQMLDQVDFEAEGWSKKVAMAKSNVEEEPAVLEARKLQGQVDELKAMLTELTKAVGSLSSGGGGKGKAAEDGQDGVD